MSYNPTQSQHSSSQPTLAPDWTSARTPDGRLFYVNSKTAETTWDPPLAPPSTPDYGAQSPPRNPPAHAPAPAQSAPGVPPPVPPKDRRSSNPIASFKKSFMGAVNTLAAAATSPYQPMGGVAYGAPAYNQGGMYGMPYATPPPTQAPPAAQPMSEPASQSFNGQIFVNGVALDQPSMMQLQMMGLTVAPGRYWYDSRCGAWGCENGPCLGVIAMGLALGGPLRPDASGPSITGVYINGRQIHAQDAMQLQALGVTPVPGRWWLEADGRYGLEGTFIPLGNLRMQAMASSRSGYGSWSDSRGNFGGSDGQGFGYVGGTDSTGRSWSVSYGG